MERLLDIAARELGIDRVEIRRRNYIPPDAFPYDHEILFQDFRPLVYDSGNYPAALEKAVELIGYERLRRRGAAPAPRARGATSASASCRISKAPASAPTKAPG